MDPQQRQLLEVSYECAEAARVTLSSLSGANIGCYVANFTTDYTILQAKDPELFHRYSGTGMGVAILSNRISHAFNLKGPSITLDTACSGSIYALQLACSALRNRECDAAIVGGANLIQSPELYMGAVKAGMTSGSAACHTFNAAADGYARAEGVGALFVKRLDDALRDGDCIRSVIRGIAVNSNGRTNGISLPSVDGQEAVIRKAYRDAGLSPNETDYVEAHGTGTVVGDGVEIEAFCRVIRHHSGRPTPMGSVKTNLGHSEAVSGITSIIKGTLSMEHGIIPPTIGITQINPKLDLEKQNAKIVASVCDWPESSLRRCSINSFSYGGSNGHVVLEQSPQSPQSPSNSPRHPHKRHLLCFSTSRADALESQVEQHLMAATVKANPAGAAFTLSHRRSALAHRAFTIVDDIGTRLGPTVTNLNRAELFSQPKSFCFVFTGQGAQWPRMAKDLYEQHETFRRTVLDLDHILASKLTSQLSWSLEDIILSRVGDDIVKSAQVAQPTCTAIQIALVDLLASFGIRATSVVGHSSGEIAAAYAAQLVSAEDALQIAFHRGDVVAQQSTPGAIAAVGCDAHSASQIIADLKLDDNIYVACINSQQSTTVSGDFNAIESFVELAQARGLFVRKLKTPSAYHSTHMRPAGSSYEQRLAEFLIPHRTKAKSAIRMFSSVKGDEVLSAFEASNPAYWRSNLESTVQFQDALQHAANEDTWFLEVGPHNALKGPVRDIWTSQHPTRTLRYLPAMTRNHDSNITFLHLLGSLFLSGLERPSQLLTQAPFRRTLYSADFVVELPSYPWDHSKVLKIESRINHEYRTRRFPPHEILGLQIPSGSGQTTMWRTLLKPKSVSWLADHRLNDTIVFPAAGYLTMAGEALRQLSENDPNHGQPLCFTDVKFLNMLDFQDQEGTVEIFTELTLDLHSLTTAATHTFLFNISTFKKGRSTVHVRGYVGFTIDPCFLAITHSDQRCVFRIDPADVWYEKMLAKGLNFGRSFRRLGTVSVDPKMVLPAVTADVQSFDSTSLPNTHYSLHPTYLDAMFQACIISSTNGNVSALTGKVPTAIQQCVIFPHDWRNDQPASIVAESRGTGVFHNTASAALSSKLAKPLVQVTNLQIGPWQHQRPANDSRGLREPLMQIRWKPDVLSLLGYAMIDGSSLPLSDCGLRTECGDYAFAIAAVMDLYCHRRPRATRLLLIGDQNQVMARRLSKAFQERSALSSCGEIYSGSLDPTGSLFVKLATPQPEGLATQSLSESAPISSAAFDLIALLTSSSTTSSYLKWLRPKGCLLAPRVRDEPLDSQPPSSIIHLDDNSVTTVHMKNAEIVENGILESRPTYIIHSCHQSGIEQAVINLLVPILGSSVQTIPMTESEIQALPTQSTIICTAGLSACGLTDLTTGNLRALQALVEIASVVLWVQNANIFSARNPNQSLLCGLSRTLMMEHPAFKSCVLDLDASSVPELDAARTIAHIEYILDQILHYDKPDLEFVQSKGILYISRFGPCEDLNGQFQMTTSRSLVTKPLADVGNAELNITDLGRFETLHFVPRTPNPAQPAHGCVRIETKAIGINAKDYYVLRGLVQTEGASRSLDFAGVVTQVGPGVTSLQTGDHVVGMAPNKFETILEVPEWSCCKLEPHECFTSMVAIPIVVATALYALRVRAQLSPGETVLIHCGAGGVGIAAIQVARLLGARVYTTVGSPEKRDFVIEQLGIPSERIFSSRDASFLQAIRKHTGGVGVDVVLNSLTGALLQASWEACAEFGRFVDISKKDSLDGGKVTMSPFQRSTSYHAFDLSALYHSKQSKPHQIWSGLLHEAIHLSRTQALRMIQSPEIFTVSEVSKAFLAFSSTKRIGKVVISLENSASPVMALPPKFLTTFDPEKSYVLVGCLGGLGASLSSWMVEQGARHLVFLGRSGTNRGAAKRQVAQLTACGAKVEVVRGDVGNLSDCKRVVHAAKQPIGGVVHAAMNLDEALFTQMSLEQWSNCVRPKVMGAWNLHYALHDRAAEPDFFLMTSSVAGTVGLVTESNYCASNAFLDHFARFRRSRGLAATSVGLGLVSDVGYLHENPEIEKALLRRGIHPYTSSEVLHIIDLALSRDRLSERCLPSSVDPFIQAHVFTGLELQSLAAILQSGFQAQNQILDDPRAAVLQKGLDDMRAANTQSDNQEDGSGARRKEYSAALEEFAGTKKHERLAKATQDLFAETVANLLLTSVDALNSSSKLAQYGIDSILTAELRSSVFKSFSVDVTFGTLLETDRTLGDFTGMIIDKLLETANKL